MLSYKDYEHHVRTETKIDILRVIEKQLISQMNKVSVNEMVQYAKLLDKTRTKIDYLTHY
jgi:hypothetical protein